MQQQDYALWRFYTQMGEALRPYFPDGITQEQAKTSADLLNAKYPQLQLTAKVTEAGLEISTNLVQVNLDTLLAKVLDDAERGNLIETRHLDA